MKKAAPKRKGRKPAAEGPANAPLSSPSLANDGLASAICFAARRIAHGDDAPVTNAGELAARMAEEIRRLFTQAASGNRRAATFLCGLLLDSTEQLNTLATTQPDLFRETAGTLGKWPIVANRWFFNADGPREQEKRAKQLLRTLRVIPSGKRGSPATVGAQIARELHDWLASVILSGRLHGPAYFAVWSDVVRERALLASPHFPLTKKTADQWWKAARPLLRCLPRFFGSKEPLENRPEFSVFWKSKEVTDLSEERRAAKVRDLIYKSVRVGFRSIAPQGKSSKD